MRVLITGGLGHIGSALIRSRHPIWDDISITVVDDLSTHRYCSTFSLPTGVIHLIPQPVVTAVDDALVAQHDVVIHLAALTDAEGTAHQSERVLAHNLGTTRHLVEICARHGVRFIFPSSTSVYGSQANRVDESCSHLHPQSPYAESKLREEETVLTAVANDMPGMVWRFGTIVGPSPGMRFHTAVNRFCWQAALGQPLTVWRTALDQVRPYLDLKDAVEALIWSMSPGRLEGRVVNAVTENLTVAQILAVLQQAGMHPQLTLVDSPIMNQLSYEVDNSLAREAGLAMGGSVSDAIWETCRLLAGIRASRGG